MQYTDWSVISNEYEAERRQSKDALFTIGNGYIGLRGFFEEDNEVEVGNGGIYVAGIVGKGEHRTFTGKSREICNITNILRANILVNGIKVTGTDNISGFSRELNMKNATYTRKYVWDNSISFEFSRFADMANVHRVGQKIKVKSLSDNNKIDISVLLDTDVVNLNKISCEPLPVQPGRNHIIERKINGYYIETVLDDEDLTKLYAAQKVNAYLCGNELKQTPCSDNLAAGVSVSAVLNSGDELVIEKLVSVYTDKYDFDAKEQIYSFIKSEIDFSDVYADSADAWKKRWSTSDIFIETDTDDNTAVRYNLFELMCACPVHTEKISIGARGLTGEMYEGCVFWDTEIFQLPFFIFSDPDSAQRLLAFRYHTLKEAKEYAKQLRMPAGAQYPWQASEKGIEQTESSAGFFSVHLIADIAYALRSYVDATGDYRFLAEKGTEILIETARFWTVRSVFGEFDGQYHIMTVRGPNEYSPIVDDNAFTNYMVSENLKYAAKVIDFVKCNYPDNYEALKNKTAFDEGEIKKWLEIAENLYVCYDKKRHLVAEYAAYFNRYPFDIKKYKPTAKRILESGTPYDYLYFYQITKQADTVLLMCILPELFSDEEKMAAYEYYEPRTVHDSSLSYAPHAWLAARLGKIGEAYEYFKKCAYLDITDIKLNTVSGLHMANFGGTWSSVIFGFCGVSFKDNVLSVDPHLPDEWKSVKFSLLCKGEKINIEITKDGVKAVSSAKNSKITIAL